MIHSMEYQTVRVDAINLQLGDPREVPFPSDGKALKERTHFIIWPSDVQKIIDYIVDCVINRLWERLMVIIIESIVWSDF